MWRRRVDFFFGISGLGLLSVFSPGCGLNQQTALSGLSPNCAPLGLARITRNSGTAKVFMPDPIAGSGNASLMPTGKELDQFATSVTLSNLSGLGVLDGSYVSILNRVDCADNFGAYNQKNQFIYPHSDFRFQEAMSYYFGDAYQAKVKANGYLVSQDPVVIIAHCESVDNSYFTKAHDQNGIINQGREFNEVCLGDSSRTPGAFYADDAQVVIHELQHAATVDNYSSQGNLNQFFYDEAGALNEAISDFVGLAFSDNLGKNGAPPLSTSLSSTPSVLDPRLFSRWALGTFNPNPNKSSVRGAHRCPMYDSSFPNCTSYPSFSVPSPGTSSTINISYIYPDGLGWPFPDNYKNQNVISNIYQAFPYDEEIHNDDIIMVGTLWEIYAALKQNRQGDGWSAFNLAQQLVLETIRHLDLPSVVNRSPVTFINFSSKLMSTSSLIAGITAADRSAIQQVLKDRSLYQMATIDSASWAGVGPGSFKLRPNTSTPGVFIQDNPQILTKWLTQMGLDSALVTQGLSTGLNSLLDPGELAVIWFDIQNNDDLTAGGVLLTVASTDPDIEILDGTYNVGYLSQASKTQIMYAKVNGKKMGSTLSGVSGSGQGAGTYSTPGNTYFTTDPLFSLSYRTGIWIKVKPTAAHGKEIDFQVQVVPANGSSSVQTQPNTLSFPVTIN